MGTRERKLREYENRKNLIMETAKKLYSKKGFANVTLEDIAKEIEFSKATIYSHFDSKEEINARVLLAQLHTLQQQLKKAADSSHHFEQGILNCLKIYLQFYHQHRDYFQLLFFVDIFSNHFRIPQKLLKEIQFQKIACLSQLQKVITRGMAAKEAGFQPSSKMVAFVLWGMINGILQLAEAKQIKTSELDSLVKLGFEIGMNGLKNTNKNRSSAHGSF